MTISHQPRRRVLCPTRFRGSANASLLATTAVALAIAGAAFVFDATAAYSAGTQAGAATVKSAAGAADLGSGTSATGFTLRLPAGAACAGDTANDGYTVQSYIVPVAVDPSTLTFDANGPVPSATGANFRQPLYDVFTSPYVNAATAPATTPPGPGAIINIPDFNYAVFAPPDNIPAGTYNVGLACTKGVAGATQMKDFWNVEVTFTTDAAAGPGQVRWTAAQTATTTTTAAGGATTTTAAGVTTTTRAGSTTTTKAGTTTTTGTGSTSTSTSTTAGGSTTSTTSATGSTPTTVVAGLLARSGGGSTALVVWAVVLLILGRMTVLVARSVAQE